MDARTHSNPGRVHIVTLTLSPALDITTSVDVVRPTDKMRCQTTRYDPGGGGINVARVANVLGVSVSAIFTAGGPAGALVASLVAEEGVPCQRVDIAGQTRESFTVNENSSGQQYRFVLPGPRLSSAEQSRCLDLLRAGAESADIVVASGSLPPGVPPDYYQRVADICQEANTRLVLDTSGGGLQHIASGVYLAQSERAGTGGEGRAPPRHRVGTIGRRACTCRKRLCASGPGVTGLSGSAPRDAAGQSAILRNLATWRGERRRCGRRDGGRNHVWTQSWLAPCQIRSLGHSRGRSHVDDTGHGSVYPSGDRKAVCPGRRAVRPPTPVSGGVPSPFGDAFSGRTAVDKGPKDPSTTGGRKHSLALSRLMSDRNC